MCRIGTIKIQRKLLQRCVVSWLSFLGHFFFTRPRTWLTVCHNSCNFYKSLDNVCFCVLRFSFRTGPGQSFSTERLKHASQNGFAIEVMPLKCQDSVDDEALMLSVPKADNGYLKEEHPLRYKYSSMVWRIILRQPLAGYLGNLFAHNGQPRLIDVELELEVLPQPGLG